MNLLKPAVAALFAVGVLGKFEEIGGGAIGVEHLVAVEFAEAVDHGDCPVVGNLPVHCQIGVIDIAGQAQSGIAQHCR